MWSADIEATYRNQVQTATKQAQDNFSVIENRTPAAVTGIPGASEQITKSKQYIEQAVQTVARTVNDVSARIDEMVSSKAQLRNNIDTKKQDVDGLKKEVLEAQEINKLRKEQAQELKRKYFSNYHTSWLGLWRPLADASHMGLIIAAILFGLIAVVSGVFFYQIQTTPASTTTPFNNFVGGFLKRK